MEDRVQIEMKREFFEKNEKRFIEFGGLKVDVFQYETGIRALKVSNKKGYIIVLPFYGQMIWDAVFNGRSLRMHTQFDIPRPGKHFFETYGCLLMHCGALRAGNPGPEDTHPLHGELPIAGYDKAMIETGEDEKGKYIAVTGEYEYNRAFADRYIARPYVKMYEDSTLIDIDMEIKNLANTPMELMYMYHVNFYPEGRIVQRCNWNSDDMKVRTVIPPHAVNYPDGYVEFLHSLADEPEKSKEIKPEHIYDPEICFDLWNLKTDGEGNTYFMQVMNDGSGDFIKYKPSELDCCVRWISITPNQQTLGMALPATCGSEGYISEKAKGHVKMIQPKGSYRAGLQIGYIDSKDVAEMEEFIENL